MAKVNTWNNNGNLLYNGYNVMVEEENGWMSETVEKVDKQQWLYKLFCILNRKKLRYMDLYAILVELNRKGLGKEKSKQIAMARILNIYKFNNKKLPDNV